MGGEAALDAPTPPAPDAAELPGLLVRPEAPGDEPAIRALHDAAFGQPDEGRIVDGVRGEPWFEASLSLVALLGNQIVGHCLLSRCPVGEPDGPHEGSTTGEVLALGPIGVLPRVQRTGIGARLMREALAVARSAGVPAVVLLGHPDYYPRFGFAPARPLGLEAPAPWPEAAWLACPLVPIDQLPRGVVRFPRAFEPL